MTNIPSSSLSSLPCEGEGRPCRRFSLAELLSATYNFDDGLVIGRGGFGKVYKGLIDGGATTVAIKRLCSMSKQGPKEFWVEMQTITKFRHKHLVTLLGYCDECNEMILVYEYMEQGTLSNHLYKTKNNNNNGDNVVFHMPWEQRLKICIGAARGLDYLHTGVQGGVIHRDVKTTNILLNKDFVAKVSDFGLCKMGTLNHSISHVSTAVRGTFGYMDPEYFSTGRLTKKSDVYACGVVLLEVLCGRPAVDVSLEDEEQHSLSHWAQCCIEDGKLDQIIDPILRDHIPSNSLEVFAEVANRCLHRRPSGRPTMTDLVVSLEHALAYSQDYYWVKILQIFSCAHNPDESIDTEIDRFSSIATVDSCEPYRTEQIVHFRSLDRPEEDDFCLELSKLHTYDDVVERVAYRLVVNDPSKIRLTPHNCYSQQPQPHPIKYRAPERLLEMLVHYNQTSDILYYEVLDIPLPELQCLKTLKVAFHHTSKDEVIIHNIRLPRQSTVGDVLNELKKKVELSHANAELRMVQVFCHKIYKIVLVNEKIENVNDQYWTLRAEEVPEEERSLVPLIV